ELRGNARIAHAPGASGGLQSLGGQVVDLKYGPDGQAIQQATLVGGASIALAGATPQTSRQIAAEQIAATLAADGATPTALAAREMVHLTLPPEQGNAGRTITAEVMESRGDAKQGLTSAAFTGNVQYRERGAGVDRAARSGALDLALAPGFGSVEEARFAK